MMKRKRIMMMRSTSLKRGEIKGFAVFYRVNFGYSLLQNDSIDQREMQMNVFGPDNEDEDEKENELYINGRDDDYEGDEFSKNGRVEEVRTSNDDK